MHVERTATSPAGKKAAREFPGARLLFFGGNILDKPGPPGTPGVIRAVSRPLWIIAGCALVILLRLGREVLVPIMLAVLLALVLSGIVEGMRRIRVPRGISALVLIAGITVASGGGLDALWTPAQAWVQSAPKVLHTIEQRVRPAKIIVQRLNDIAMRASAVAGGVPDPKPGAAATPAGPPAVTPIGVLEQTGTVLGSVVTVIVLALLLLAGGPPTLAHMTATLGGNLPAVHALRMIEAIRLELGRYYGTLAVINVGLGFATSIAMWLLGMPNPVLWGVMAAAFNFVPYLGSAVTLTVLTVVALVSFDSNAHVAAVALTYLGLATIEGQIIEPVFLGRRLHLNPIIVFIALWVGGWLWGIPGVVFALPVLVAAKVAAAHSAHGQVLERFLGPSEEAADDATESVVELPAVLRARESLQQTAESVSV